MRLKFQLTSLSIRLFALGGQAQGGNSNNVTMTTLGGNLCSTTIGITGYCDHGKTAKFFATMRPRKRINLGANTRNFGITLSSV